MRKRIFYLVCIIHFVSITVSANAAELLSIPYSGETENWLFDAQNMVSRNDPLYTTPSVEPWEAMPTGGEIFIRTALVYENGANMVQMIFKDTGPGIYDENPANIFLPFYSTKKGSEQNLGLGLSVSYGIIKKYRGTITVENVDEAGCQFVITLPQSA